MLNLIPIESQKQRDELLESFDPYSQSWVSTSLTSKFDIQKQLIKKHLLLEDNSVLRANEYWQNLLFEVSPLTKIRSKELFLVETASWLKEKKISWARSNKAPLVLLNYVDQLIHVVSSKEKSEHFLSWLESNSDSMIKWGHWARLSVEYWEHIKSKNEILNSWCAPFLIDKDFSTKELNREIIFDIGTLVTPIEISLIKKISEFVEVKFLYPKNKETTLYSNVVNSYKDLGIKLKEIEKPSIEDYNFKHESIKIKKFSSQLAEVKNSIFEIRKLIDSGVDPDEILITAKQIEDYWPTLNLYLKKEGILTYKQQVSKLFSCTGINKWISRLRVECGSLTSSDIESSYFNENKESLNYEKFKRLYENIFKTDDIKRSIDVESFFILDVDENKKINKNDFFKWALKFWAETNHEKLEKLITDLDIDVSSEIKFLHKEWVYLLEKKAQTLEIPIGEPHSQKAIYCENLKDIGALSKKYVFILGVSESLLKESSSTSISKLESEKLYSDLGLYINSSESVKSELLIYNEVNKQPHSIQLSYPEHSFTGDILQPSKIWLINSIHFNENYKNLNEMGSTRWDDFVSKKELDKESFKGNEAFLVGQANIDTGVESYDPILAESDFSLSVSQIEGYKKCPFILASRKLFNLKDLPDVDMDIDRMTGGKFTHSLFEKILLKESLNYSEKEILKLIDEIKIIEKLYYLDESIWNSLKRKYLDLAKRFIKFEKEWRISFPNTSTQALEKEFEVYWDLKSNQFVSEKTELCILFRGIIDRIDKHKESNHVVLIDYKSSAAQSKNYKSWLENDMFQMGMYSFLVDKGFVLGPSHTVVGSFYYIAKTFDRSMGMKVTDSISDLFDLEGVKNSQVTLLDKESFYTEMLTAFVGIIKNIKDGEFSPIPKDYKQCSTCRWRKICRAQHLI